MKGPKGRNGTKGTGNACSLKLCLKRERDRLNHYRNTKQGAFEVNMIHLDTEPNEATGTFAESWTSDRGKAAAEIRSFAVDPLKRYKALSAAAIERVRREDPRRLQTLLLVLANGSNRGESLRVLMRSRPRRSLRTAQRKYLRDLDKLLEMFENGREITPSPSVVE